MNLQKTILLFSVLSSLAALGCADTEQADSAEPAEVAAQTVKPDPNAITFESIVPQGSGCPAGSWRVSVSDDGLAFIIHFTKFSVKVNPEDGVTSAKKDCTLSIKVKTPPGVSYAVSRFSYSGYLFLEEGVSAEQSASYNFLGQVSTDIRTKTTRWKGPVDLDFGIADDVPTRDWSPCGDTRTLLINTNIALTNPNKHNGEFNQLAADGNIGATTIDRAGRIEIDFAKRACPKK